MEYAGCARTYHRLLNPYLAVVFVLTIWRLFDVKDSRARWTVGDWLINYEGGFVRRGFAGEVFLDTGRVLHVSPVWLALLLSLACYAVMFFAVWKLLQVASWNLWIVALAVSPVTLSFGILNIGGWGRKEILYLAGLGILLLMLLRAKVQDWLLIAVMTSICPLMVLCHEPLICFFPYYFGALVIARHSIKSAIKIATLPLLFSTVALVLVIHHPGNATTAANICDSLGPLKQHVCGGAIDYLASTSAGARTLVAENIQAYHYYTLYSNWTIAGSVPIIMAFAFLWRYAKVRYSLIVLLIATGASCAASLVLFLYAVDWGRWIYIHIFSVFFLLLFIDYRRQEREPLGSEVPLPSKWRSRCVGFALFLYATSWSMPNVPDKIEGYGYLGFPIRILNAHLHGS
ncbi:hypothetical protein RBB79_04865 [Tunturiibacter empetritectus]|uniref:Uncharacterized protein n=1 Tax=Tunturiibacter lichenicola TaxID=2051959 RepID=A0A852V776_9BACT|nr:hypothetical protein [Edaphobacter lichenicola]NYF88848.1 hypothetical protein [Edaphobacter lichenicola]